MDVLLASFNPDTGSNATLPVADSSKLRWVHGRICIGLDSSGDCRAAAVAQRVGAVSASIGCAAIGMHFTTCIVPAMVHAIFDTRACRSP